MSEKSNFEKFVKVVIIALAIGFFPITIILWLLKISWDAGAEDYQRMSRGEPPKWAGIGDKNFMNPKK